MQKYTANLILIKSLILKLDNLLIKILKLIFYIIIILNMATLIIIR